MNQESTDEKVQLNATLPPIRGSTVIEQKSGVSSSEYPDEMKNVRTGHLVIFLMVPCFTGLYGGWCT